MLLDSVSPTLTHCLLLDKYEDIHTSALDDKLNLESLDIKNHYWMDVIFSFTIYWPMYHGTDHHIAMLPLHINNIMV